MKIHHLTQGTPEWEQFRLTHFGASEAAAMLGLSKQVGRNELLHMKHTGNAKEFGEWVQTNILDYGHEVEAMARPLVEEDIGDDLYPVTCSDDDDKLSASCDGLTMVYDTAFEHKQWNAELAAAVSAGFVPDTHMPQCQQILMITGAKRVRFTVSDGTRENFVWIDVEPDTKWFDRIRAGWAQFEKDLTAYQPREYTAKPEATPIMALPTLAVQIRGEVVASNLPSYRVAAERFIAEIKTDLKTDEDFANAEQTVKFCENAENELEVAKKAALSQTASIADLMRTIDHISGLLRAKRLSLNSLVESRKKEIKEGIFAEARAAYAEHLVGCHQHLGGIRMTWLAQPDFSGAGKGKRTVRTLREAVDTALANAKIAADAAARDVQNKLTIFDQYKEHHFLFSDLQQLIQKPADDFRLSLTSRIDTHKQEVTEREAREAAAANAPVAGQEESASRSIAPPAAVTPLKGGGTRAQRRRPSDAEIIQDMAMHYGVTQATVIEWLREIHLPAAA